MNITEMILYGILVVILSYIFSLTLLNFRKARESKNMLTLREYEINMKYNININIIDQLDQIIMNCFNEYMILNIEFRELEYINKEIEDVIIRDVAHLVIDRLSPVFYNKISLVYNKNNISDIISKKVYLFTMNYVLTKNNSK